MTERPILCRPHEVRAILDGRKTQTRRIMKPQPPDGMSRHCWFNAPIYGFTAKEEPSSDWWKIRCPYGQRGDRLWVRETWQSLGMHDHISPRDIPVGTEIQYPATYDGWDSRKRSPLHMPRWASRLTLEITDIRVERLQGISEADAEAEGAEPVLVPPDGGSCPHIEGFERLWESINGAGSWDANPWVWVIGFKRVTP